MSDSYQKKQVDEVVAYHHLSKHYFNRYAPSLGYLDWATQPDSFRRYAGAKNIPLRKIDSDEFLDLSYESVFHGNVVDMLHFPIWSGLLPEWLPLVGGKYFSFFDPVFNVADVAISTGIGILIFFNKKAFNEPSKIELPVSESHNNLA